ncbi:MAG TPA: hypothetical protein VFR58_13950 [Flavisolibacter sp.]|nr:hypothetical protein [Flavisolibacter sp.]
MCSHFYKLGLVALVLLSSCASLVPVNNHFERAATLGKGNAEVSGQVSRYRVSAYGRNDLTNSNYGLQAGYGITDNFDLKLRYEQIEVAHQHVRGLQRGRYFSLIPKLSLAPDRLAAFMPVSVYDLTYRFDERRSKRTMASIAPHLIYTQPVWRNHVDLSLGFNADLVMSRGATSLFIGSQLGAGFSTDLKRWALRPEIAYNTNADARLWNYGLSFQWTIPLRK